MTTKSDTSLTMNKDSNRNYSLVKGAFTADEAREVLMALIESKITFHSLKNLRSFEQSGETDSKSKKRIEELENMREEMLELIKQARKTGFQLQIKSTIDITIADNSSNA
ncbi:MAG TPA: hypothetical protein VJ964_07495 [Balneolaceae bacterium]|nr:hypothetical protein [Balneolaceae bacterium]